MGQSLVKVSYLNKKVIIQKNIGGHDQSATRGRELIDLNQNLYCVSHSNLVLYRFMISETAVNRFETVKS